VFVRRRNIGLASPLAEFGVLPKVIKLRKARQYQTVVGSRRDFSDRGNENDILLLRWPSGDDNRPTFEYISDNPYRLLSMPSSAKPAALIKKAELVHQAIRDEEPVAASLGGEFGGAGLGSCPAIARKLAGDPVQRTVYRQLWPYELSPNLPIIARTDDLATYSINPTRKYLRLQKAFLVNWYGFLATSDMNCLRLSLRDFAVLYEDGENERYLQRLLEREGENSLDAYNAIVDAQNTLATYLIGQAVEIAVEDLERGFPSAYRICISALKASGLDEGEVRRVLIEKLRPIGNGEAQRIQGKIQQTQSALTATGWLPAMRRYDASEVTLLCELARSLDGDHDDAGRWRAIAQERIDQVVRATCRHAVFSCDPDSADSLYDAEAIISRSLKLPVGPQLRHSLKSELRTIERLIADVDSSTNENPIPSGHKPASRSGRREGDVEFHAAARLPGRQRAYIAIGMTALFVGVLFAGAALRHSVKTARIKGQPAVSAVYGAVAATTDAPAANSELLVHGRGADLLSPAAPFTTVHRVGTPQTLIMVRKHLKLDIARRKGKLARERKLLQRLEAGRDAKYSNWLALRREAGANSVSSNASQLPGSAAIDRTMLQTNAAQASVKQAVERFRSETKSYNKQLQYVRTEAGELNWINRQLNGI
jgi:hypothetical protein